MIRVGKSGGASSGGASSGGGMTPAQSSKLSGVQYNATKNLTDEVLLGRENHTGTQPQSTIDGLPDALDSKVDKVAGKGLSDTNYTQAEKDKLNGVADEATKNLPDATLLARANHTGTQPINTVAGLQAALDAAAGSMSAEELARLVAVEDTLPHKADLEGGKLALSQMPDIAAGRKSTVSDEAARLTLDVWPDLTIAYQTDDGNAYALDANDDPSVPANWSMLGSGIADGVGSFNSRAGNVLPQAGDYTAEQITESAAKQFVSAAEKAEWTAKETVVGAQTKATAAGQDAKDYADSTFIEKTQKGAADGVATLDATGKLPATQLKMKTINGEAITGEGDLAIEVDPTNLSQTRTATSLTVTSSTGNDAVLPSASTTLAGVMRATDKEKLNTVEEGATNIPRITGTLTVTVGSGGDYPKISDAIDDLIRRKKVNSQLLTTIHLLPGFMIDEQIFVRNTDLSWISLTSDDELITSTFNPSTTLGNAFGYGPGQRGVFAVANGKLPLFYKFNYQPDISGWTNNTNVFTVVGGGELNITDSTIVYTGTGPATRLLYISTGTARVIGTNLHGSAAEGTTAGLYAGAELTAQNSNFRVAGSDEDAPDDIKVNVGDSYTGNIVKLSNCQGGTSIAPNTFVNGSLVLSN